jgi:hypothetical protein
MTIQSHWTNENYRENFDRIFGKKYDAAASTSTPAPAKVGAVSTEKSIAEEAAPQNVGGPLVCSARAIVGDWWSPSDDIRRRTWLPFCTGAANIEFRGLRYLWSAHRPDGAFFANGSLPSLDAAERAADAALRDFCKNNREGIANGPAEPCANCYQDGLSCGCGYLRRWP